MIDLTLRLDYEDEAELFNSYLWGSHLSKAIEFSKCESFRTSTPIGYNGVTALMLLDLFRLDDEPLILCFEDDGTDKNYAFLHSNDDAPWTPDLLRRHVTRIEVGTREDPPTDEPVLTMYLRKEN